ncbi:MAG: penicillin-binding protein 2 [Actinobacteria bacterium]|nr:penicillin-binding protein 2 [Actinomycetota bacterium]
MVALILTVGLAAVGGKLVILQSLQAEKYLKLASEQRELFINITPRRGTIFDREGEVMAISEDVTTVYATPYQVRQRARTAKKIAQVLGEDPDDVEKKLAEHSGFVYIARKIDNNIANRIKKMDLPGIGFVEESKRSYPLGEAAAQVLGVVDIENDGQAGLELYYEDILGGKPGEVLLERDAAGNPIPGSEKRRIQAVEGVDLELAMDKDIQICAENALSSAVERTGAKAGTALVMDCNTGDILAMASDPGFDPNDREDIEPASMRSRAITDVYEPGSSLKIIPAVAALEQNIVNPDSSIYVPSQLQVTDKVFKDAEPKPSRYMTFSRIISESSNVGTIEVGLQLGRERLNRYFARFGLGHKTGVDFPGEVGGLVPRLSEWTGTSVAAMSIGQGISTTALQLASVAGTIANGGRRVYPHFLKAKVVGGGVVDMGLGGLGEEVVSRDACKKLTGIMEQVVAPGGTAPGAAVRYYRVAGKTGTAEKPIVGGTGYSSTYMATFVGFAPADSPRLVALVVLDEPTPIWGGVVSAPVFSEIMGFSLQHLKVPPSWGNPGEQ